ncbi:hypothetical protein [Nitratifractor sp.]|uniref:hypothetical protein n=1 Tax=Nitratifractor sp. TaxID=2268144 RepID=UPI0025EA2005|nr:hypothetical protein [Nitratifractor sp.]
MSIEIIEGMPPTQLIFHFPDGWVACQFDSSRFYRKVVDRLNGMKAVDIVAAEGDRLILMEVKDFRGHSRENLPRQTSGALLIEVAQKFVCTLSALLGAQRSGLPEFAPFYPLLEHSPKVQMILFLERDPHKAGFLRKNRLTLADLKSKLRRLLVAYNVHCQVYDRRHLPAHLEWSVE